MVMILAPRWNARAGARPMNGEPFRQGQFDGLCGLYAIVDALDILRDSRTSPTARTRRTASCGRWSTPSPSASEGDLDGTKVQHVRRMLVAADAFARRRYKSASNGASPSCAAISRAPPLTSRP